MGETLGETLGEGETLTGTLATLGLAGRGLTGAGTLFVEGKLCNDQRPSMGSEDSVGYASDDKGLDDNTLGQVRESGGVSMVAGQHI